MQKLHLSVVVNSFSEALFNVSHKYLIDLMIWNDRMAYYVQRIERKCGGVLKNIWGFIDATIYRTCHPYLYQNLLYTKYKKCHGIKFQSIVVPNGFIAYLYGPFVAKRHDARML